MPEIRVPEGYYTAVAVPMAGEDGTHVVRWGQSKEKTKYALVYFEILEGEHKGSRLPWFGYFTQNSVDRTLQAFRYMGWKGDDLSNPGELDQEVSITVEHNEWDGKVYARVAWVNRPGGGQAMKLTDPLSANDIRMFAARLKSRAQSIAPVEGKRVEREASRPAGNGSSQPSLPGGEEWGDPFGAPAGAGAHGGHDDVPF